MISVEERSLLYYLALHHFRDEGSIVDAGCFLGASTASFAFALKERGLKPRKAIHAYDLGIIGGHQMARHVNIAAGREAYKWKDPFGDMIQEQIAPFAEHVELRIGDIMEKIHEPDPIEILFLDVCKLPNINGRMAKTTFPRLTPGRSIVVHQDYFHDWDPWLHVTMGHFQDRFAYLGSTGGSAVFLCERAISEEEAAFDPWYDLPPEGVLAAFEQGLLADMDPDQIYLTNIARSIVLAKFFGLQKGIEALEKVEQPSEIYSNWTMPPKSEIMTWI